MVLSDPTQAPSNFTGRQGRCTRCLGTFWDWPRVSWLCQSTLAANRRLSCEKTHFLAFPRVNWGNWGNSPRIICSILFFLVVSTHLVYGISHCLMDAESLRTSRQQVIMELSCFRKELKAESYSLCQQYESPQACGLQEWYHKQSGWFTCTDPLKAHRY